MCIICILIIKRRDPPCIPHPRHQVGACDVRGCSTLRRRSGSRRDPRVEARTRRPAPAPFRVFVLAARTLKPHSQSRVNPGSLYRCGWSTLRAACGPCQEENGGLTPIPKQNRVFPHRPRRGRGRRNAAGGRRANGLPARSDPNGFRAAPPHRRAYGRARAGVASAAACGW